MEDYKDRLFCFIFGLEEHKEWTLSLYNAVNGTSYTGSGDDVSKEAVGFMRNRCYTVQDIQTIASAVIMAAQNR